MGKPFAKPAAGAALNRSTWTSSLGNSYALLRFWPFNETAGNAVDSVAGVSLSVVARSGTWVRGVAAPAYASALDVNNITTLARIHTPPNNAAETTFAQPLFLPGYYVASNNQYRRCFQINGSGPGMYTCLGLNTDGTAQVGGWGGTQDMGIAHGGSTVTFQIGAVTVRVGALSHAANALNQPAVCPSGGANDPYADYWTLFAGTLTAAEMAEFMADPFQLYYPLATSGSGVRDIFSGGRIR